MGVGIVGTGTETRDHESDATGLVAAIFWLGLESGVGQGELRVESEASSGVCRTVLGLHGGWWRILGGRLGRCLYATVLIPNLQITTSVIPILDGGSQELTCNIGRCFEKGCNAS